SCFSVVGCPVSVCRSSPGVSPVPLSIAHCMAARRRSTACGSGVLHRATQSGGAWAAEKDGSTMTWAGSGWFARVIAAFRYAVMTTAGLPTETMRGITVEWLRCWLYCVSSIIPTWSKQHAATPVVRPCRCVCTGPGGLRPQPATTRSLAQAHQRDQPCRARSAGGGAGRRRTFFADAGHPRRTLSGNQRGLGAGRQAFAQAAGAERSGGAPARFHAVGQRLYRPAADPDAGGSEVP